jgi:Tfp pilus assembly protein PilW
MTQGLQRRRGRLHRHEAGFSLIELSIAMVAGLMVAMAVMGVSKESINTFHEEVRVSGAEMALRIAMERLRLDLQRAAFMGTGNITGDPMVVRNPNCNSTTPALSNISGTIPFSLQRLSGIALHSGDATAVADAVAGPQLSQNGLTPDTIDIGGNFSSTDEYVASIVWPTATGAPPPPGCAQASSGGAGPCTSGPAISLQMNTPSMLRITEAETTATNLVAGYKSGSALLAAFHPGASKTSEFLLRLTDPSGRYQYLISAPGGVNATTYYNTSTLPLPNAVICLASNTTILKTTDTGGLGGVSGLGTGWVVVSPLQIARWDIQTLTAVAPSLQAVSQALSTAGVVSPTYTYGATQTIDPYEFVLTRSFVDMYGCGGGSPCAIDPYTTEIVAEYAVDLKFGLNIDTYVNPLCASFPCPITPPQYPSNPITNIPMDATSTMQSSLYASQTVPQYAANFGPQRIRDVQARIGIRSRYPDRTVSLTPPAVNSYIYRYQIPASVTAGSGALAFARVRESTAEINLSNQARFYW